MFIIVKIRSKDENSIKKFTSFIKKETCLILDSSNSIKPIKNKFTALKSPHVNKRAQEQFEVRTYKCSLIIYSPQVIFSLASLKLINDQLYRDVQLKIEVVYNINIFSSSIKKQINTNKFKFDDFSPYGLDRFSCLEGYLKLLDIQGETRFKDMFR